jgi:hypothetical protein
MRTFLRSVLRHVVRVLALSCLALALPLPGVNYIVALSAIPFRFRQHQKRLPRSGCLACDCSAHGCDAGQPHWILTLQ